MGNSCTGIYFEWNIGTKVILAFHKSYQNAKIFN